MASTGHSGNGLIYVVEVDPEVFTSSVLLQYTARYNILATAHFKIQDVFPVTFQQNNPPKHFQTNLGILKITMFGMLSTVLFLLCLTYYTVYCTVYCIQV